MSEELSRRGVLAFAGPLLAAGALGAGDEDIAASAHDLARRVAARHGGGEWKVVIDNEFGFIMIMPRQPQSRL